MEKSYQAKQSTSYRPTRKFVVVGDGGCGKTSLLTAYAESRFPEASIPTVFENYVTQVQFEGKEIDLALWDTAEQGEYDRLRLLSYPDSNVVLIVFSIDLPTSLANVQDKWYPEVTHFCYGVPLLLVGTKIDLRSDDQRKSTQGQTTISPQQGAAIAKEIGAKYIECSAKTGCGVHDVFDLALKESRWGRRFINNRPRCIVI